MPNSYGPVLKEKRKQLGIKAAFVARRIHVSPPTYSAIESGKRGLEVDRLREILSIFDMTLGEFEEIVHGATIRKKKA